MYDGNTYTNADNSPVSLVNLLDSRSAAESIYSGGGGGGAGGTEFATRLHVRPQTLRSDYTSAQSLQGTLWVNKTSRKHACIIMTPLNIPRPPHTHTLLK